MHEQRKAIVDRARALLDAAAPTPWEVVGGLDVRVGGDGDGRYFRVAACQVGGDADFIAAAPELVRALCDALEAAEADAVLYRSEATSLRDKVESGEIEAPWRVEVDSLRAKLAEATSFRDVENKRANEFGDECVALRAKLAEATALHGIAEARERRLERELLAIWAIVLPGEPAPLTESDVLHAVEDVRRERDALRAEVELLRAQAGTEVPK